jgi:hypothetical protein
MRCTILGLLLALLFLSSPSAQAAKPMIIGWGEQVAEVSEAPKELREAAVLAGAPTKDFKVGYMYNSIRIFWIPMITWSGKYVYYEEKGNNISYGDIDAEERKWLEGSLGGKLAGKGGLHAWWARWVNWLWVVIIGLVIARKVMGGRSKGPLQYPTQPS